MRESLKNGIFTCSLICVTAAIPLTIRISSLTILAVCMTWLLTSSIESKVCCLRDNWKWLRLFLIYYSVLLFGLVNSENIHDALKELEKNSGLLVIPIILATCPMFVKGQLRMILLSFVLSCICVLIIDLFIGLRIYSEQHSNSVFFYYQLSNDNSPFHHNPIYLSIYFLFSIVICVTFLKSGGESFFSSLTLILFIFLLVTGLVLLSSKMVFFLFCGYVVYEGIIFWLEQSVRRTALIILPLIAVIILITFGSVLKKRYLEVVDSSSLEILKRSSANDFAKVNGLTLRLMFWKWGLMESRVSTFFIGEGTGDVQDYLNNVYEKHNLAITMSNKEKYGYYGYNAHNQYVETYLKNGILGMTAIFLLFGHMLFNGLRRNNHLLISLVLIILFINFSESFLETNKGIIFSALFISLFSRYNISLNGKEAIHL